MKNLFPLIKKEIKIDINGLSVSRGNQLLFENLSSTITNHDIVLVRGDNGIGKTSLLEAISGLLAYSSGDIKIYISKHRTSFKNLIAYQPSSSYCKTLLTTKEELNFWANIYNNSSVVDDVLKFVKLQSAFNLQTQNLSTGQRKRLEIAKVIVTQKPVWIFDEPYAGMDDNGVELIDTVLKDHVSRGGIAILASHKHTKIEKIQTQIITIKQASDT
jgi:heme exporter protein A